MKYNKTNKDGSITTLEGTPEEIASYHKRMTHRSKPAARRTSTEAVLPDLFDPPKRTYRKRTGPNKRPPWNAAEDAFLLEHGAKDDWSWKRVAKALAYANLSNYLRSDLACLSRYNRISKSK